MIVSSLIAIKLERKPVDTFILQVYMPTSTHKDEEIEETYEQISEVIEMTNEKANLIVLGEAKRTRSNRCVWSRQVKGK